MSKDWTEREYCSVVSLWSWIDEATSAIDLKLEVAKEYASDAFKMLLLGKREMLDELCKWLSENETTLKDIADMYGLNPE